MIALRHCGLALALVGLALPLRAEGFLPMRPAEEMLAERLSEAKELARNLLLVVHAERDGARLERLLREEAEVAIALEGAFVVLRLDAGREDVLTLCRRLGIDPARTGLPCLAVLDAGGELVASRGMAGAELASFLREHAPERTDGNLVLARALAAARASGKPVLLRLSAPWCGWCHVLDDMLASSAVAEIVDRRFVPATIDVVTMLHGEEIQERYRGTEAVLPWYGLLDAEGELLAHVRRFGGYPVDEPDVDEFIAILDGVAPLGADRAALRRAILGFNAARKLDAPEVEQAAAP